MREIKLIQRRIGQIDDRSGLVRQKLEGTEASVEDAKRRADVLVSGKGLNAFFSFFDLLFPRFKCSKSSPLLHADPDPGVDPGLRREQHRHHTE